MFNISLDAMTISTCLATLTATFQVWLKIDIMLLFFNLFLFKGGLQTITPNQCQRYMLTTAPTKNLLNCQLVGCILYITNKLNFHFGSQCCDSCICRGFFTNVVAAITSGKAGRYSNFQMQQSREEITLSEDLLQSCGTVILDV